MAKRKYLAPRTAVSQPADPGESRTYSPTKLELLITVVEKSKAGFYIDLIQSFDVNMQFSTMAQGTADKKLLQYLGLSNTDKTAIFSVVRADQLDALMETLDEKFRTIKNGKGIAAAVPFSSMIGKLQFGFLSNDKRMVREG